MCGIAGIVSAAGVNLESLRRMNRAVRHRGPNDEGYALFSNTENWAYAGENTPTEVLLSEEFWQPRSVLPSTLRHQAAVGLAHRRLSIFDLSANGHQPMSFGDGRYWIVFNGEIYNFVELRAELQGHGYQFRSDCDTEVILASFEHWGESCLSRFLGMWAFALYDRTEQTLLLARDRFGIKPLYYWRSPGGDFAFASEIKQFESLDGWAAAGNSQRIYDYLVWGLTDHSDETLFDGVLQVPAGCLAKIEVSRFLAQDCGEPQVQIRRWYSLDPEPFRGSESDAIQEFLRCFTESMRIHVRADVPIGSCLSGGLDSSAIVCLMAELLRDQGSGALQQTFSARSDEPRYDEGKWIEHVLARADVANHSVVPVHDDLLRTLSTLTRFQDEPFGSSSIFAQWKVFELAAGAQVPVMLDGQGADEILGGYNEFVNPVLVGLFRRGAIRELLCEYGVLRERNQLSPKHFVREIVRSFFPSLQQRADENFLRPDWINFATLHCSPSNPFARVLPRPARSIAELSHAQLASTNLPMLLHWEDRNSMAHSIESRVPFLDHRLVELVLSLPDQFKFRRGTTKLVAREAFRDILPEPVRMRGDKLGFVTAEEVWMTKRAPVVFRKKLEEAIEAAQGVLTDRVLSEFDETVAGRRAFSFRHWRIISFAEWVKQFNVRC